MFNIFKKKLLIVRIDAIGDYVLFRNYLEHIKKFYNDYQITLLGNIEYKEIAEHFDNKFIDKFIWINKHIYCCDKKYIEKLNNSLRKTNYDLVISPVFSRDNWTLEPLISSIRAKEKIGFSGDLANISYQDYLSTADNYSRLIESDDKPCFEFLRNKEFVEKLLNLEIAVSKPHFKLKKNINFEYFKENYAVVFPGAGKYFREWDEKKYSDVINFIINKYGLKILLLGGPSDIEKCNLIVQMTKSKQVLNLVGTTKLYELPYIFSKAQFVLTGDTCAYHIAVAVNTKTFCISNGNTFCRFVPYPNNVYNDVYFAFSPEIEYNINDFKLLTSKYINGSDLDINKITAESVIKLTEENYKGQK